MREESENVESTPGVFRWAGKEFRVVRDGDETSVEGRVPGLADEQAGPWARMSWAWLRSKPKTSKLWTWLREHGVRRPSPSGPSGKVVTRHRVSPSWTLSPELLQAVKARAEEEGKTQSQWVEAALNVAMVQRNGT